MKNTLIYPAGSTDACQCACDAMRKLGFTLTDHPEPEITHLLLDVPSFRADGKLRNGSDIRPLLSMLPQNTVIVGGNLDHPDLSKYNKLDLLKSPFYLAQNASITADCALRVAAPLIKTTFTETPTLLLGWGRIGKVLAQLLRSIGCPVTIAARKESDRALLQALGYASADFGSVPRILSRFRLLINTVPAPILDSSALDRCKDCVMIELASNIGLDHPSVVLARGLPAVHAPESSGNLIAHSFYQLWKEQSI